jgi:hypothetical protein
MFFFGGIHRVFGHQDHGLAAAHQFSLTGMEDFDDVAADGAFIDFIDFAHTEISLIGETRLSVANSPACRLIGQRPGKSLFNGQKRKRGYASSFPGPFMLAFDWRDAQCSILLAFAGISGPHWAVRSLRAGDGLLHLSL